MNRPRSLAIMLLLGSLVVGLPSKDLRAQSEASPDTPEDQPSRQVAWQIKLGARVAGLASQLPRADRVVLVPDLPTWLDEIQRWGPRGTWPVLIEDDHFTPIFIRRFAPRQLVRRNSVGTGVPGSSEDRKALALKIQSSFWRPVGSSDESITLSQTYRDVNWRPPGIVATSFEDPAWPAALALAILRGQLLVDLPGDFGQPNGALDEIRFLSLNQRINGFFESSGWSWKALGDDLDALTLCRSMPVRVNIDLPSEQRPSVPGLKVDRRNPPVALTDLLCRNPDGSRFALCGWIFGSQKRSIYMAMCSLFIDRDSIALVDGYDRRRGGTAYALSNAEKVLEPLSYGSEILAEGERASRLNWLTMMSGGVPADVLFINSSGQSGFMDMTSGSRLQAADVPALNHPLALYLIHSFSLFAPDAPTTIGARWLDRGVYSYVGSCNEPLLGAFRPASHMIRQMSLFVPFIVAARMFEGEFSKPWRLVTIGDPLMLVEQPARRRRNAIDGKLEIEEAELDVRRDLVRRLRAREEVTPGMLRDLHLLGQDELVSGLWQKMGDTVTPDHAKAMLPFFFGAGDTKGYREAFALAGEPEGEAREMLWTLHGGRTNGLRSASDIALFERNLRENLMAQDLESLMPSIIRARGSGAGRAAVVAAMNRKVGRRDREMLTAMLERQPR